MSVRSPAMRRLHVAAVSPTRPAAPPSEAHHPAGSALTADLLPRGDDPPLLRLIRPSVLIVEDDEKLARLMQRLFARSGYRTHAAPTGDDALRSMRTHEPDAAVIDIMIPHPDGIEVCRQFRRDGWTGPIVAISGRSSLDDHRRVEAAGADSFLTKPFQLTDLLATVESLRNDDD